MQWMNLSYGGGVNSTAIIAGLMQRNIRPQSILFADTGGERPETLDHVAKVSASTRSMGFPSIETVRAPQSLEDHCIEGGKLPSIAYGIKACSMRWKRDPIRARLKELHPKGKIVNLIGIDAGEQHRARRDLSSKRWQYEYPLVDWGWDRDRCIEEIKAAGLPVPGKSACFFCPASKKQEVKELARNNRDLFDRAVAIERGAQENLQSVKGLGRHWSWEGLVKSDEAQGKLFPETVQLDCLCEE